MNFIAIVGIVASIGTGTSLLPQLFKICKEKKPENISFGMLAILFVGVSAWIYYGILKNDWIIIISNGFSLLVNIAIVSFSIKFKNKPAKELA